MTKAEQKRRVSAMLKTYRSTDVTGDDADFLHKLIRSHPDYPQKFGAGVKRFFVADSGKFGVCFWFESVDGIVDNFGTTWCIDGRPSERRRLLMACRAAVQDDMHAVKAAYFGKSNHATCQATGVVVRWDQAHVDHVEPFVYIAGGWLDMNPNFGLPDLAPDMPGSVGDTFADPDLAAFFRSWHRENAKLRVVSAAFNMSKGAR